MGLHESIGAMVGAGIGAMRSDLDGDASARIVDDVSHVLSTHPADLPGVIGDRLDTGDVRGSAVRGAADGVSALSLWDRLLLTRRGPNTDRDLVRRAVVAELGHDGADSTGWPGAEHLVPYFPRRHQPAGFVTPLPQDPDVLVGDVAALADVEVDAVVSLCRMGTHDVSDDTDHLEVWLVDDDDPAVNPNLAFVLRDVAEAIGRLRDEDKRVFVHCVRAESRTSAAAAAFLALRAGLSGRDALAITDDLIPGPGPRPRFRRTLQEIFPPTSA